jgi:hypothetical protein
MAARSRRKSPATAGQETVVLSVRVRPETEVALRDLARETGLAFEPLLARAATLLRADPAIRRLTERVREVDALLAEIRAPAK